MDDPITDLVACYKQALLMARLWQSVAAMYATGGIPGPTLESERQRLQPPLEEEFAVYEKSRQIGSSQEEAVRGLLAHLRRR